MALLETGLGEDSLVSGGRFQSTILKTRIVRKSMAENFALVIGFVIDEKIPEFLF